MTRMVATSCLALAAWAQVATPGPAYEVYAVRFAHVPYALSSLVRGAERGPTVDIAFTVWPIKDPATGKVVLVDAGFHRQQYLDSWKPQDYVRPSEALSAGLGIAPNDVTDIILTHSHWDHADGVDLFPRARIWIQRAEFEYYVGPQGDVRQRGGPDADLAKMLAALNAAGRLHFLDGDDQEVLPGIRVYTGGKHTYESQFVRVLTRGGAVVIASDNAYLYRNVEDRVAIAQTVDAAANVAALGRMTSLASAPELVVPGHDPAVFTRFAEVKPGVVRVR